MDGPNRDRRILAGLFLLGGLAAAIVLFVRNPEQGGYPVCPTFALFDFQCSGCGTLRALHALLHGRIAAAFGFNPLTVVATPLLAVLAWNEIRIATGRHPWNIDRRLARFGWIILGILAVFTLVRNLV